jgi:hypothetical protein
MSQDESLQIPVLEERLSPMAVNNIDNNIQEWPNFNPSEHGLAVALQNYTNESRAPKSALGCKGSSTKTDHQNHRGKTEKKSENRYRAA